MHPNATDPLRVSNGNDPVHVSGAIAEAMPATTGSRRAPTGHGAMPGTTGVPEPTRPGAGPERSSRTGWTDGGDAIEAEEIVADIDQGLSAAIHLVEAGARADAHDALLRAGNALRDGAPLDVVGAALQKAAAEVCTLATASARVRAALEGIEL